VDVPMAKRLASSSLHDYELTRRLWLLVAQHTVNKSTDLDLRVDRERRELTGGTD
jgi:hypothetical protein